MFCVSASHSRDNAVVAGGGDVAETNFVTFIISVTKSALPCSF